MNKTFYINMYCSACELKIESRLKLINGISKVQANYKTGEVTVTYNEGMVTLDEIKENIKALGYDIKNKNIKKEVVQNTLTFIIIGLLFFLLNKTGIFNKIPDVNEVADFASLFFIGLFTGIHCIAMCGGINLSQSLKRTEMSKKLKSFNFSSLLYNTGRVLSYTIIGGVVGSIGSTFKFSLKAQGAIIIIASFFMVIIGLNFSFKFNLLKKITPSLPKSIINFLARIVRSSDKTPFIVGMLNGAMPCGPLQTMQLYALSTGSFLKGSLSMFIFGTGTSIVMLTFGMASEFLTKKFNEERMFKTSGVIILFLAVTMFIRASNLLGIPILLTDASKIKNYYIAKLENNIQYVESELKEYAYPVIVVQKGINVKWNIKATSSKINGCNNRMIIPQLKKEISLKLGDNIIEFTPEITGDILYTCWMGMITSKIKIVSDINNIQKNEIKDIEKFTKKENNKPNCCSTGGSDNGIIFASSEEIINNITKNLKIEKPIYNNNFQNITMIINEKGYSPNVLLLKKGEKIEWNIKLTSLNEKIYRMIIPKYNSGIEFKKGINKFSFVAEESFIFSSWKGDYHGAIIVLNNIDNISRDDIINLIKQMLSN